MVIHWFRRDLRLYDNAALAAASASGLEVLPIFICDAEILTELPADDARVNFFHGLLESIDVELQQSRSGIAGFLGSPEEVFTRLASEQQITAVYANADYEPYARSRDQKIKTLLESKGIAFHLFKDHVIFEPGEILKPDMTPYVVFTPFAKKWKIKLASDGAARHETGLIPWAKHGYRFPSLFEIGFKSSTIPVPGADISKSMISSYGTTRDFPALPTSRIGPHLRFGSISVREAVKLARESAENFLNELIWREFFAHVLWHFPQTVQNSFRPKYDNIQWRNDEADFLKWQQGETGYPLVDAGMRELNATGFMHNRVRMVAASFLCKHLLIDWRWGEAYFALKLLDYEQSSNVGNWQWAAGSGTDAAPYFRIFNPAEQARKFDGQAKYIKKWIPEIGTSKYPEPITDHVFARERCLQTYRQALI